MKLKSYKGIFAAMITVLAISSCKDDMPETAPDTSTENEVRISATIGDGNWNELSRANKDAEGISIKSFSDGDKMVVDAWYLPYGSSEISALPDFMRRQEMEYNSAWIYSPVKYWPNNSGDRLVFFAYNLDGFDKNSVVISDNDANTGYPEFKFSKCNYMNDILVSPVTIATKPAIGGFNLPMKHIMAYIKVKARVATRDGSNNNHEVKVKEVWFNNEPHTATFCGFDDDGNPIWKNISIFKYFLATKGDYVKVNDEERYIKVDQGKGNYVFDGNNYIFNEVAEFILLPDGSYKRVEVGDYVKDTDGTFVKVEDDESSRSVGNYKLVDGNYVEVHGPGDYVGTGASAVMSKQEVVIPATGEYVDLPDAAHLIYPFTMPFLKEGEDFGIFFLIGDDKQSDSDDIGAEFNPNPYGYFVYPEGELKGGHVTTFYVTIGLNGIDNVETETRPWVGWSEYEENTTVTFGK